MEKYVVLVLNEKCIVFGYTKPRKNSQCITDTLMSIRLNLNALY